MTVREKNSSRVDRVLHTIENAAIAFFRNPARTSGSLYRMMRDFRELQELSDAQIREAARYVVRKKYIRVVRRARNIVNIELTRAGKKVRSRAALDAIRIEPQKTWDRKWRIVIFDIPNHLKSRRDGFAGALKRIGFRPYQKSVFICPFPCEEELQAIAGYFGVTEYIDIVVAEKVSRSKSLQTVYRLT